METIEDSSAQSVSLLQWPWLKSKSSKWPPHQYPWTSRDERSVLLWISTQFDSVDQMAQWVSTHAENPPNDEHLDFICWLDPCKNKKTTIESLVEQIPIEQFMPFIFTCLNRSLLWDDPSPVQPSDMLDGMVHARRLFSNWQQKKPLSNTEINSALSVFEHTGWSVYLSQPETKIIQTVYNTLSTCCRLETVSTQDIIDLMEDVRTGLILSIENYWLYRSHNSDWIHKKEQPKIKQDYLSREYLNEQKMVNDLMTYEKNWIEVNLKKLTD